MENAVAAFIAAKDSCNVAIKCISANVRFFINGLKTREELYGLIARYQKAKAG